MARKKCKTCKGRGYTEDARGWGQCSECKGYGFIEEGVASRGPELSTPLLKSSSRLEVQGVPCSTVKPGGCQTDCNACDDHFIPLGEAGELGTQLYSNGENDTDANGD